jgi:hypothetical protein
VEIPLHHWEAVRMNAIHSSEPNDGFRGVVREVLGTVPLASQKSRE